LAARAGRWSGLALTAARISSQTENGRSPSRAGSDVNEVEPGIEVEVASPLTMVVVVAPVRLQAAHKAAHPHPVR
jgi:hypothetical protein